MTLALLFALGSIVICVAMIAFYHDRELLIAGNNASINAFEKQMNTEIAELEKNALDLAVMGEIYYKKGRQRSVGEFFAAELLKNYPNSMGNGIYFKAYKVEEDKDISCIHAVWEETREISQLQSCVNSTFDYFQQNWYSEIKNDLENGLNVSWVRPYKSTQLGILMTTVGAGIYDENELVGMATVDWELDTILKSIFKIKPTPNSFVLFADKTNDYIIATTEPGLDNDEMMGKTLADIKWYSQNMKDGAVFSYKGEKYISYVKQLKNGFFLIVNVPLFELFRDAIWQLVVLLGVLLTSTLVIVFVLYHMLKRNINQPIDTLTEIAEEISSGNLEKTIYIEEPAELAKLATAFNKMKTDMKTHLTELSKITLEKEKMLAELNIANTIQSSAMPKDFPKTEYFELAASMTPARAVGGDFYDFFPIDENHAGLVMADVCGKGITAALYMMSAKTAIKDMLQAGYPIGEAINKANNSLCNNAASLMFVTAFIGILDFRTGEVEYVNAGHCPPLLQSKGEYQYVDVIKNVVMGVKSGFKYNVGKFKLSENDRLFLYTDGITEAQTKDHKFYGAERLVNVLNEKDLSLAETLDYIYKDIQRFIKGAPQFDDITMMVIEFYQKKK